MSYAWLLLIPVGLVAFVGFWCLIVKGLSVVGWRRLAEYQRAGLPAGPRFSVARATIGGVSYKGALEAGVSPEGLSLQPNVLFSVGHPPLLIPWASFGYFQGEKFLWDTSYTTEVRTAGGGSITISLSSNALMQAARPWIQASEPS